MAIQTFPAYNASLTNKDVNHTESSTNVICLHQNYILDVLLSYYYL